jgi:hypothetical protein
MTTPAFKRLAGPLEKNQEVPLAKTAKYPWTRTQRYRRLIYFQVTPTVARGQG